MPPKKKTTRNSTASAVSSSKSKKGVPTAAGRKSTASSAKSTKSGKSASKRKPSAAPNANKKRTSTSRKTPRTSIASRSGASKSKKNPVANNGKGTIAGTKKRQETDAVTTTGRPSQPRRLKRSVLGVPEPHHRYHPTQQTNFHLQHHHQQQSTTTTTTAGGAVEERRTEEEEQHLQMALDLLSNSSSESTNTESVIDSVEKIEHQQNKQFTIKGFTRFDPVVMVDYVPLTAEEHKRLGPLYHKNCNFYRWEYCDVEDEEKEEEGKNDDSSGGGDLSSFLSNNKNTSTTTTTTTGGGGTIGGDSEILMQQVSETDARERVEGDEIDAPTADRAGGADAGRTSTTTSSGKKDIVYKRYALQESRALELAWSAYEISPSPGQRTCMVVDSHGRNLHFIVVDFVKMTHTSTKTVDEDDEGSDEEGDAIPASRKSVKLTADALARAGIASRSSSAILGRLSTNLNPTPIPPSVVAQSQLGGGGDATTSVRLSQALLVAPMVEARNEADVEDEHHQKYSCRIIRRVPRLI